MSAPLVDLRPEFMAPPHAANRIGRRALIRAPRESHAPMGQRAAGSVAGLESRIGVALRSIADILLRRGWLVLVAIVVAVGVALALSFASTDIYAATSRVVAEPQGAAVTDDGRVVADPSTTATHVELIKSTAVGAEVAKRLGGAAQAVSGVRVKAIGHSHVISITVESSQPGVARDAANFYADVYIEQRKATADELLKKTGETLARQLQDAKADVNSRDARIAIAAGVNAHVTSGTVRLVEAAQLPTAPVRPRPLRNALMALLLGAIIGALAAFVFDHFDDIVKTADDVRRHAPAHPILAAIPAETDSRRGGSTGLITIEEPSSAIAEAYRSLRTSVQLVAHHQPLRTLLITSPSGAEGKTRTIANLGVAFARAGRRVVCVDCDLRAPRLHEFFGLASITGFTTVLLGDQPLSACVQPVSIVGGGQLRVLAAGPLPPNPAELLSTRRVDELLTAIAADADIVLIDAPPIRAAADAVVLSQRVDGVLLVATAHGTSRGHLSKATELLTRAGAPTVGIAFVGASAGDDGRSESSERGEVEHRLPPVTRPTAARR